MSKQHAARQVTKIANLCVKAYTIGPPPCTTIVLLRDHVQIERRKFFPKIERYFGFPHDSNY